MIKNSHNPDVLNCLANLSSDEVFTSPKIANEMLDMLPKELFTNPDTTFLDPCCKSGVFLREIAKRLLVGLEKQIPDLQQRINHIFTKQLYGIAITQLTSLLSRRSVYCSKTANGKYSIATTFSVENGNIKFDKIKHTFENHKCKFCGVSDSVETYTRDDSMETHAYEFIHTENPQELFNMKFDVIIGNPPYQLNVGDETSRGAIPIYHKFVEQAKKLQPRYLSMIIPSRWFSGGIGMEEFRQNMLNDKKLRVVVDYINSSDCFMGVDIAGGVNYFLWERDYYGLCLFTTVHQGKKETITRDLSEFGNFVRFNEAVSIIRKIKKFSDKFLNDTIHSLSTFGLRSMIRGNDTQIFDDDYLLLSSAGKTYIHAKLVNKGIEYINKYKVVISKTSSEHAGMPDKNGMFKVLSTITILSPNEICTESYIVCDTFENKENAMNLKKYLETRFVRFLVLQALSSMNISKDKFAFVPMQDFNESWTDEKLYKKYNLTKEEIDFIESMIKPME